MTALAEAPAVIPAGAVVLDDVTKVFGGGRSALLALDSVSLSVAPGEFACLLGASGCGKSTLLSLVSGLDDPTAGRVHVAGRVGLMFQEPALLPWSTAAANVALPMILDGAPKRQALRRAEALLRRVHLDGTGAKRPHELSGGMRQRVALARALAQEVDVLLMDEPFASLDAMTRELLHEELERLWRETGITVLFVTHDVREAVRLGDRVLVLSSRPGRLVAEFPVGLPRPRSMESPGVGSLAARVTTQLREEVRHG